MLVLSGILLLGAGASSSAHGRIPARPTTGISIPGLTHGQLTVIADYRGSILGLAAGQVRTDETFRRLLNFTNIQHAYCLWGLVPGSLHDEESPFNQCSHAYLSATKALLVHMLGMGDQKAAAEALISEIDADMVRNKSSFVMCRFSGEAFNTASIISVDWAAVPFHGTSLMAFATLTMMLTGGGLAVARQGRGKPQRPDRRAGSSCS